MLRFYPDEARAAADEARAAADEDHGASAGPDEPALLPTRPAPLPTRIPKLRLAECFPRGAGGLAPPVRERWPPARDAVDV